MFCSCYAVSTRRTKSNVNCLDNAIIQSRSWVYVMRFILNTGWSVVRAWGALLNGRCNESRVGTESVGLLSCLDVFSALFAYYSAMLNGKCVSEIPYARRHVQVAVRMQSSMRINGVDNAFWCCFDKYERHELASFLFSDLARYAWLTFEWVHFTVKIVILCGVSRLFIMYA